MTRTPLNTLADLTAFVHAHRDSDQSRPIVAGVAGVRGLSAESGRAVSVMDTDTNVTIIVHVEGAP